MTHNLAELPFMTLECYFSIERHSSDRHEYINGVMYAMAGGSIPHSQLIMNIGASIRTHLRGTECSTHSSELRVLNRTTGSVLYPDITVICGEPITSPLDNNTVINPLIIVEVLSPSTEAYDRGAKFAHYKRLETLQVYVLVTQEQPLIQTYTRNEHGWQLTEYTELDAELKIETINFSAPLRDVYEGIRFDTD